MEAFFDAPFPFLRLPFHLRPRSFPHPHVVVFEVVPSVVVVVVEPFAEHEGGCPWSLIEVACVHLVGTVRGGYM